MSYYPRMFLFVFENIFKVDRICVDASTNITALANSLNMTAEEMANKTISSAEQYFMKGVLKEDGDITNGIGRNLFN